MQTSLFVAFAAVLIMSAVSIDAESVCSIHGQSHIVMTDGRAKFSYHGEGLYQVFSAIVDEHAVDVQCEFKRSSSASDVTQLGECRVLVTSQTCKADVRFADGQVSVWGQPIPMKNIDEFSAKSLDKSLGLAIHALASNAVGLELSFGQQFISISLAPFTLTITSGSLAKCDGLCGSCSGPQTAPEFDLVAAYAAAFKIDAGHAIVPQKPCSSLPSFQVLQSDDAWPLPTFNAPNVSQAVPVFQSAAVRDAVVQQCSDGDLARIAADPLFGSFVEDCIADKSAGPMGAQTAKSTMDAFVTLIENRQKAAVAEQSLKDSPNATVCAACMNVEWEKPINTTGILEPTVTMRPDQIAPGTGAEYPLAYSPAALNAGQNDAVLSRKNDLYASAAPLYKPPTNLYTATPAPIHNLYATKTNAPAMKANETPFPTVASPAPSVKSSETPFPTVASPAPSTAGKSAEPTLRPTSTPVVASPAPTTAARTYAPATNPNVTSPAPTTAKTMMPTVTSPAPSTVASPAPTTGAKGYDSVMSMTTVPTTAPSGASAAPVNQTRAPSNSTTAPATTSPSGGTVAPSTQTPQPSNGTGTSPTTAPAGSSAAPTNQTRAPTDAPGSSAAPTNQTRAPSGAPTNQANTTTAPLTTSPSGANAAPINQTTAPLNGSSVAPASTAPTSAPSNGSAPITAAPTTAAPTTAAPTTAAPTTAAPTTAAPTTAAPTTAAPTTAAPTTAAPTTAAPTTAAPTTAAPTTAAPTTTASTASPVVAATTAPNATSVPVTTAPATSAASVAPATTAASVAPASTTAPIANATAAPLTATRANQTSTPVPTSGNSTAAPTNQTMGSSAAPTNQTRAPATSTFAPTTMVLTQAPINRTAAPATPVPTTTSPTNKPINLPPVYNCNCTISSEMLETNRDLVTYAKQSKLIPSLQKAIRDGRNPELLAIMACGGAPDLATILEMDQDTTTDLCKVCTKSKTQPALSYQTRRQSPIPSPVGQQTPRVIPQTTARRDYNVVPRTVGTPNRAPNTNVAKGISYVSRRRSSVAAL